MPCPVVVLDTNVLIPLSVRDTIFAAAEEEVCAVRWTEQILEEMRRTLVIKGFITGAQMAWLVERMHAAFPEALITGYEPAIYADDQPSQRPPCCGRRMARGR